MRTPIQKLLVAGLAFAGVILGSLKLTASAPRLPGQPVMLAAADSNFGKGSENKGRYYFRQTCKTCHTKGAAGGEVTPLNKTQAQWKSYFLAGKHARGKEALSKVMSEDQLRDVGTFLFQHAADSLQPETCGK